jgi:outer membrane protein
MISKYPFTALLCTCLMLAPAPGVAQSAASSSGGFLSGFRRPYTFRHEAPVSFANSGRLDSLLRAGNIYLSLQDAIALALENNLDIELQRYAPRLADADLLRANAGSATRGVSTSVSAGPTSAGGSGTSTGVSAVSAATVTGGAAIPSLDPSVSYQLSWGHQTTPQTSSFTTGTTSLINTNTVSNFGIQKGFLTGTTATLSWYSYLSRNNSGRSDFNPSTTANFNLQVSQKLLQGFGMALNRRNIRIAQNSRRLSDLVFKQQVIATITSVMNLYWDLVSYNEDVKVKRQAVALAQKLLDDNQKQVDIGTLAPIEVVRAEAQLASGQQDLVVSETRVLQQETILKNYLSRVGVASPTVSDARIIPTDQIIIPATEQIEPIQDLISAALTSRPEVGQTVLQVQNTKIGLEGTKTSMRPTLDLVATFQNSGLAGQINSIPTPPLPGSPAGTPSTPHSAGAVDPYFLGGYGTALSQLFRRNFPNYSVGFQFNVPLRNRSAQADMISSQLSLRQQEIRQQQQNNQIRVDVTNALIAVQQARAVHNAAVKTRVLQERTLDAEQKKYTLGASTNYLVIQAQRDLAAALSTEVAARSSYTKARVTLDQAVGRTLDANSIQIDEAISGKVSRPPSPLPALDRN